MLEAILLLASRIILKVLVLLIIVPISVIISLPIIVVIVVLVDRNDFWPSVWYRTKGVISVVSEIFGTI